MDCHPKSIEAGRSVGKGCGSGLEEAVWGDKATAHQPAGLSLCKAAVLGQNGEAALHGERRSAGRCDKWTLSLAAFFAAAGDPYTSFRPSKTAIQCTRS